MRESSAMWLMLPLPMFPGFACRLQACVAGKAPFHDFQCQMCQAMLKVESAAESTAPLALVAEVEAETVSVGVRIASGYVPKICDSVGFSPVLFGASC